MTRIRYFQINRKEVSWEIVDTFKSTNTKERDILTSQSPLSIRINHSQICHIDDDAAVTEYIRVRG